MANKTVYILTRAIRGAELQPAGAAIELTDAQAQHPLYRNRIRKADLVTADAPKPPTAKQRKSAVCKRLKELGVEFDSKWDGEALEGLLPEGELEALFPTE